MRISVKVKPSSRRKEVVLQDDGSYVVFLSAPPIEGRANSQLLELLADHFGQPKSNINILRGSKGRFKIVEIQ